MRERPAPSALSLTGAFALPLLTALTVVVLRRDSIAAVLTPLREQGKLIQFGSSDLSWAPRVFAPLPH